MQRDALLGETRILHLVVPHGVLDVGNSARDARDGRSFKKTTTAAASASAATTADTNITTTTTTATATTTAAGTHTDAGTYPAATASVNTGMVVVEVVMVMVLRVGGQRRGAGGEGGVKTKPGGGHQRVPRLLHLPFQHLTKKKKKQKHGTRNENKRSNMKRLKHQPIRALPKKEQSTFLPSPISQLQGEHGRPTPPRASSTANTTPRWRRYINSQNDPSMEVTYSN